MESNVVVIPMLSWDPLAVGAVKWTPDRKPVPCELAYGVELKIVEAMKSEPLMVADKPWEHGELAYTSVMWHDGLYRMYYGVIGGEERLCYAESEDGFEWVKPNLGIIEYQGSSANNICLTGLGSHCGCVFIDPTAKPEERYKNMAFSAWWEDGNGQKLDSDEGLRRFKIKNEAKAGEETLPVSIECAMIGWVSPDGLHWTALPEPVLNEWHDTNNIVTYDETKGKYVGYFRGFYGGRRAVSYGETDDFAHWPPTWLIHGAQIEDGPTTSVYACTYSRYPGNRNLHVMFPTIYRQTEDTMDTELAVSLDGLIWERHVGQPIIPHGAPGSDDEAFNYTGPQLLRCHDGKFRMIFHAGNQFHNEGYEPELRGGNYKGYYAWAEWEEDRLAGICAKEYGQMTVLLPKCGSALLANYRTEDGGWIKFEMIDRVTWPPVQAEGLAGYRFDDMDPMTGDQTKRLIKWGDISDLGSLRGTDAAVRVRMHKATLYAIAIVNGTVPENVTEWRFPVD
jgi:hypothetical protein